MAGLGYFDERRFLLMLRNYINSKMCPRCDRGPIAIHTLHYELVDYDNLHQVVIKLVHNCRNDPGESQWVLKFNNTYPASYGALGLFDLVVQHLKSQMQPEWEISPGAA